MSAGNRFGNGRKERRRGTGGSGRRPWRRRSASMTLNLAPMIDVTFLLLIFFSVTSTFKRAEGYLQTKLPRDVGQVSVALPINPIVVRIEQYREGPGGYRITIDQFLNTPATFGELARFLEDVQGNPGFSNETPVIIAAAEDASWDHVVNAWNAAVRAGCRNISFGR